MFNATLNYIKKCSKIHVLCILGEEDNCNSIPSTPNPMVMPQQEALNLEVSRNSSTNNNNDQKPLNMKRKPQEEESMSTTKRLLEDERFSQRSSMPHAHLKISSNRGINILPAYS